MFVTDSRRTLLAYLNFWEFFFTLDCSVWMFGLLIVMVFLSWILKGIDSVWVIILYLRNYDKEYLFFCMNLLLELAF